MSAKKLIKQTTSNKKTKINFCVIKNVHNANKL